MAKATEEVDVTQLKLGKIFTGAKCLLNSEVGQMLAKREDQFKKAFDDPFLRFSEPFELSLKYTEEYTKKQNEDERKKIKDVLSGYGVLEYEICAIGNLVPESADEVKAFVPSMKRFDNGKLEEMLRKLPQSNMNVSV